MKNFLTTASLQVYAFSASAVKSDQLPLPPPERLASAELALLFSLAQPAGPLEVRVLPP